MIKNKQHKVTFLTPFLRGSITALTVYCPDVEKLMCFIISVISWVITVHIHELLVTNWNTNYRQQSFSEQNFRDFSNCKAT